MSTTNNEFVYTLEGWVHNKQEPEFALVFTLLEDALEKAGLIVDNAQHPPLQWLWAPNPNRSLLLRAEAGIYVFLIWKDEVP